MDRLQAASEMRRVMQLFAQTLTDEAVMMEVAGVFPDWVPGVKYPVSTTLKYGLNQDGEAQLYLVQQEHTSQADWTPDKTPALYKKVGFTDSGVPIWTQPLGAHDAYTLGDRVEHNGRQWVSTADGNVWEPGVYGWTEDNK